ncbi:MAG TPA: hypothetical protein VGG61_15480 [Gemmataceae bacterium]
MARFLRLNLADGSELHINPEHISAIVVKNRGMPKVSVRVHMGDEEDVYVLKKADAESFLHLLDDSSI